jgi:hypothetical protein
MPKVTSEPNKLVNRQALGTYQGRIHQRQSGLLKKAGDDEAMPEVPVGKQDDIRCVGEVVEIASLRLDPINARLHPERNLASIRNSLSLYGQQTPIVVRRSTGTVIAGNGRVEAAASLGWTKIAVSWTDLDDVEAVGYGIADNRTAELAKWDTEVLTRSERLLEERRHPAVGFSNDELGIIRRGSDFVEPPADFKLVGEDLETEHQCPRCGYRFSGMSTQVKPEDDGDAESCQDPTG